ncbi:MAG: prephenate dehydratase [Clostridium sp.]|jgi:prephenate dehydratase|nr:prephenate dehydratase [Clostridium sp.]
MIRTGFLGPKGTFSQEAMTVYTKEDSEYTGIDYSTMTDLIMAVSKGEIDEAVVPIENSLEGAVSVTLDMLATELDIKIKAEVIIPISQNLLIKRGTRIENIKYILSHPQAVGQCRKYIDSTFPDAMIKYLYSTAEAAKEVAGGMADMAAIGSKAAAAVYELEILRESIQDNNNNLTRFIVISKKEAQKSEKNKTSIVFSTENRPGSLYRILDIFSLWDINMTRIESRPAKNKLGRYIFFVDIEGHIEDEDVRDALTMVKRKTSFYKFLGSYPEFEIQL